MCAQEKSRLGGGPSNMQPFTRPRLEWLQAELNELNLELHDQLWDHAAWQVWGMSGRDVVLVPHRLPQPEGCCLTWSFLPNSP